MSAKNFITHREAVIDLDFTSLQGTIQATMRQMVKAFGQPVEQPLDKRASAEWSLQFSDGTVASIYTWKRERPSEDDPIPVSFFIGGNSGHAVSLVHQAFRKSEGLRAAA